jgi:hypothetical protein
MKNIQGIFIFLVALVLHSCGLSEDCLKGNGKTVTKMYDLPSFDKIKVYDGVGLVIKQGPVQEIKLVTGKNILDDIEIKLELDTLKIKDQSTCNSLRDYGQTIMYVTTPNITQIHSKTNQQIRSDGTLNYPVLYLYAMDLSDGAGTGDFNLDINSILFEIATNNVSNFYISGTCTDAKIFTYWGNSKVNMTDLNIQNNAEIFHRGANDITLKVTNQATGNIYATGNIILKNNPNLVNITEHFSRRLIYN